MSISILPATKWLISKEKIRSDLQALITNQLASSIKGDQMKNLEWPLSIRSPRPCTDVMGNIEEEGLRIIGWSRIRIKASTIRLLRTGLAAKKIERKRLVMNKTEKKIAKKSRTWLRAPTSGPTKKKAVSCSTVNLSPPMSTLTCRPMFCQPCLCLGRRLLRCRHNQPRQVTLPERWAWLLHQ